MKKKLCCLFFMYGLIFPSFTQDNIALTAQEVNNPDVTSNSISKTTPLTENTPASHWSVGIKGGINYFRISASTIDRTDQFHLSLGGLVEYTINPLFGLGIEYLNNPYGCRTQTVVITGGVNDAILFGSINLSNLLLPNRLGNRKFNIYGKGGMGFAFYNFSLDHAATQTDQSAMITLSLNTEYTLCKSLSLGLEAQYLYYNWKLEQFNTIYNTEAMTATIALRYKFGATGKKQHARNMSLLAYNPIQIPVVIEKVGKDNTAETLKRVKTLEDENAQLINTIKEMKNDIQAISIREKPTSNATIEHIEFEFGSDKLAQSAYPVLDQVAELLKNNSSPVSLSIAGYTDYKGTAEYNLVLSVKRAHAVKVYLLSKNVPASRIVLYGYGKENPIAPNGTAEGRQRNRRVEFHLTK